MYFMVSFIEANPKMDSVSVGNDRCAKVRRRQEYGI